MIDLISTNCYYSLSSADCPRLARWRITMFASQVLVYLGKDGLLKRKLCIKRINIEFLSKVLFGSAGKMAEHFCLY